MPEKREELLEAKIREELVKFVAKEEEASKRKLINIIEGIPEPLFVTDVWGKIEQVNKIAKEFLGYSEIELLGKEIFFFAERDLPKFQEIIRDIFEKKFIENVELVILNKEKKEIPCLINVSLLTDFKGKPIGMVVALKDISELKLLVKELEEAKTVLEIKVQARTRELRELTESLEEQIKERTKELEEKTKELQKRVKELEKFHKLVVGRELKMVELKREIEKLKKELKKYGKLSS